MPRFKNVLVSVSDKTGLVDFLKPLHDEGTRLVSTGGTAKILRDAGCKVIDVSEQTGFPECMDGRVKTLHPRVHMALLARAGNAEDAKLLKQEELEPFDMVIVNLYPFEQTLATKAGQAELIENIDIGGPSLLRAAAKNFDRVAVVVDPADYKELASGPALTKEQKLRLAAKAFAHVSSYDAMISQTLGGGEAFPHFGLGGTKLQELRYGENPHQKAYWYKRRGAQTGWQDAKILQGKELSYNNLLDLESALGLLREFDHPSAVAVKHNNPCGAASSDHLEDAVAKCLASDPVSVFGGIVAVNQEVSARAAEALNKIFLECIVAPSFSADALAIFEKKKNLRLLEWKELGIRDDFWKISTIQGGFLVQEPDRVHLWNPDWKILGEHPSPEIRADLSFAWAAVAHLKSNAIAIAGDQQSLGFGMGQTNRVDSVKLAIQRMNDFHPQAKNSTPVLASDAFFPFADSIEQIAKANIRWVIQPGGSMRDQEVFAMAKELGVNLVLTGQRHFRH
jgi:phosphoribosylaminoimidazolecarboxamide formyltransferase/IMP cyclohydrolase